LLLLLLPHLLLLQIFRAEIPRNRRATLRSEAATLLALLLELPLLSRFALRTPHLQTILWPQHHVVHVRAHATRVRVVGGLA
jgi:hypothetical protein